MKKITAILLLTAMTLTFFSACTSEAPQLLEFLDNNTTLDLDGETITILNENDVETQIFGYKHSTLEYDEMKARIKSIEDKYDCVIELINIGNNETMREVIMANTSASGSTYDSDIFVAGGNNILRNLAYGNALLPLTDVRDYIDYTNSEKFGSAGFLEAAMVDGIPYAVKPSYWLGYNNSAAFYVTYNIDMLKRAAMTDFHEYYENETWTWETYENIFKEYTPDEGSFTFATSPFHEVYITMLSNGVQIYGYIDGEFKCDFNEPKTMTAIDWYLNFYNTYKDEREEPSRWGTGGFTEGNTLMTLATASEVTRGAIAYSDIEYSIMPYPCGPDIEYGQWANFTEGISGFAISAFSDEPEVSAMIINDLFEPFGIITEYESLEDYYAQNIFLTHTDAKIFLDVGEYCRFRYWGLDGSIGSFLEEFEGGSSSTAAQLITRFSSRIESIADKEIKNNFENYVYDALYGDK